MTLRTSLAAAALFAAIAASAAHAQPAAARAPAATPGAEAPTRYYAVTLLTSFAPISNTSSVQRHFSSLVVYQTKATAFGREMYFLRVGFFASFADATATKDAALAAYPGAWATEVPATEYNMALAATRPPAPAKPTTRIVDEIRGPRPEAPKGEAAYAVSLETSTNPRMQPTKPIPAALKAKRLYVGRLAEDERIRFSINLGFFREVEDAEAARKQLLADYPVARVIKVSFEDQQAAAKTAVTAPETGAPAEAAAPVVKTIDEKSAARESAADTKAAALMLQGREALTRGDNADAVATLNSLLRLPPNRYSQDAQELLGLAHERNGEANAAKREYELYLRLYPESEGAERVRQRVATLGTTVTATVLKPTKKKDVAETTIYGSWSQYYYYGSGKRDTTLLTTPVVPATTPAENYTVDQKMLRSTLNLTQRQRDGDFDNRAVIRDTHIKDSLNSEKSENRVYSAYYEMKQRRGLYSVRAGRQPASAGGVLGYFDGVQGGYSFAPKWRINAVAGKPADVSKLSRIDTSRSFYGTSLDAGTFAEHWNVSLYTIKQVADGETDRFAAGSEIRYFDPTKSFFLLNDYDTYFGEMSTQMLQGNWTVNQSAAYPTTLNLMLDRRKSPTLQLTNALIGETTTSISTLLETRTLDELKAQALGNTPTTDMYSLGVTQGYGPKWQFGVDLRGNRTSETTGSPTATQPAAASVDWAHTLAFQVIGNGITGSRDISVVGISRTNGPNFTVNSLALNNRSLFGKEWTLDGSLNYYVQTTSEPSQDIEGLNPLLRLSYQWRSKVTFEVEYSQLRTVTTDDTMKVKDVRNSWSLGYRWDF
jgi:tetratricopeptide (TPR) repeat protein